MPCNKWFKWYVECSLAYKSKTKVLLRLLLSKAMRENIFHASPSLLVVCWQYLLFLAYPTTTLTGAVWQTATCPLEAICSSLSILTLMVFLHFCWARVPSPNQLSCTLSRGHLTSRTKGTEQVQLFAVAHTLKKLMIINRKPSFSAATKSHAQVVPILNLRN